MDWLKRLAWFLGGALNYCLFHWLWLRWLRVQNLSERLRDEYPMNRAEMWKFIDEQHAKGKLAVVECVTLPLRVSWGDDKACYSMYYDGVLGWHPMEQGREYSEPRYRII